MNGVDVQPGANILNAGQDLMAGKLVSFALGSCLLLAWSTWLR